MDIFKFTDVETDELFKFILEFFGRDADSANVAWYFFIKRKVGKSEQTQAYIMLTRIAKLKYGTIKRKPVYTGDIYLRAISAVRKIIKWIQKTWLKEKQKQINIKSNYIQEQTFKLLHSNRPLATEYAILFNIILTWKPMTGVVKKQVL